MNDAALAAITAAVSLLLRAPAPPPSTGRGLRWRLAARVRARDAAGLRRFETAPSRWAHQGRRHD